MKKIHLHGPAVDNAGLYHDAGTDLAIGEAAKAGTISAERARDLVHRHGAKTVAEPTSRKTAAKRARKAAPRAIAAPPAPVEPLTPEAGAES